jgi:hypothetical protein
MFNSSLSIVNIVRGEMQETKEIGRRRIGFEADYS